MIVSSLYMTFLQSACVCVRERLRESDFLNTMSYARVCESASFLGENMIAVVFSYGEWKQWWKHLSYRMLTFLSLCNREKAYPLSIKK